MSYTKHDFKSGEKLYASQLNEMDEQIYKNTTEKIDHPTTGAVGQILEIETVDENGKPKTYRAVDQSSGVYVGSGEMPEGYNIQIDPDGESDKSLVTREEFDELSGQKMDHPSTGQVGQILEIATVDENGKPKTYKAVDKPQGGGEVSDEQISNAVNEYLESNPPEFKEENQEILNNAITDVIATTVANAYTGKLTHKCVTDTTNVHNGGMLCNDPPENGVMIGETKFNPTGDGRTADCGTVNVRWLTIANSFGKNDFTFTPSDNVEIFAPSGEITRIDGTKVNATTGGFGDLILHDTVNNKYIVIAEAFVGNENVVFARTTTAENANVAPSMEFTTPQELVLMVGGIAYNIQNGLKKINSDYDSVSQYNGDIAYVNNTFYWVLTNNYKGWIVLTSSDGLTWEFNKYIVPDKGAENLFIEGAIGYNKNNETFLIAGRTKTETGYMVLTAYHIPSGKQCTKLIPDCRIGSKPSIAQNGYGYFVGHNIGNRSDYELLFVNTYYNAFSNPTFQTMDIWRINSWHGVSTQYATIRLGKQSKHYGYIGLSGTVGYANLLHCYGMDGNQFMRKGASFTYDAFEITALTLNNGNQASLENAYFYKGVVSIVDATLSETSENAVQNKVVALALKNKANDSEVVKTVNGQEPDENGNIEITVSSGGGGTSGSWELIETYTVTSGETSHKTVLSKKYKRFYIYLNSVYASGNTDFKIMSDTESLGWVDRILAKVSLTNAQYKYTNIEVEKITSGRVVSKHSNQGANQSLATASYFNANQNHMAEEYLYFSIVTDGATLTGGTIEIYGLPE